MNELLKMRLELKAVSELGRNLETEIEELEYDIGILECKKEEAEIKYREVEEKENTLEESIKNYINKFTRNKITETKNDKIQNLIYNAALYGCIDNNLRYEYANIYISRNKVYSMDGYRLFEGKCEELNFKEDMFIDIESVMKYGFKKEMCEVVKKGSEEEKVLGSIKKVVRKNYDNEGYILNTTIKAFKEAYIHEIVKVKTLDIYIFNLENNLKIAFQKSFIDQVTETFEEDKVNITYAGQLEPVKIESQFKKVIILPFRYSNIDKL